MKMIYFIEQEKPRINLLEKKHNFYIQGKMARDRKFDKEKMKEILDERILSLDEEFGGGMTKHLRNEKKTRKRKSFLLTNKKLDKDELMDELGKMHKTLKQN
jgi:hypothetical protein